ncbi:flagellar hook-associated protein 2 [Geodermatophilus amargosae]|uniref:Flagellar hook-associated protein 2 n=1 Tax=Geodermatophilus amargosae TaxID=1296565 RepID=A0A1I7A117_9ACTN|nr:flagellar filament capping protein FliD [Geodermatophilus amargosae]SFT68620.1 flagellar hook-associated protein 2 [Geodermatophilus amargosae]
MVSLSVDGLISGMDTTNLITQLVAAEGTVQNQLKTRLSETQQAADAYRSINTKMDALRSAAETLGKDATWTAAKATSSSTAVAVAVTGTPQTGSITFTVNSVAAAHTVVGATQTSATTAGAYTSLTVRTAAGDKPVTGLGTGSLNDTAAAINKGDYGLNATVLQVRPGEYALQVSSRTTGTNGSFSLGTGFSTLRQGANAKITLGETTATTTGLAIESATNTFTGVIPGGTLTISAASSASVTVDVSADPDAVAAKVQAFVEAANVALTEIAKQSANGSGSIAALRGDSDLRRLTDQILTAVSDVVGSMGSPGTSGVQLTRDGKVSFTKDTFLTRLQADPAKVRELFTGVAADGGPDGVATRVQALAKQTTNATTGTLTLLAKGREALVTDLKGRIADWDLRLAARKEALTKQFTAMETALSSLKSQSTWLAGQLSSLA